MAVQFDATLLVVGEIIINATVTTISTEDLKEDNTVINSFSIVEKSALHVTG